MSIYEDFIGFHNENQRLEAVLKKFIEEAPAAFISYYNVSADFDEWCVEKRADEYVIQLTLYGGYNKDTEYVSFPLVFTCMTAEEIETAISEKKEATRQRLEAKKRREAEARENYERRVYETLKAKFEGD